MTHIKRFEKIVNNNKMLCNFFTDNELNYIKKSNYHLPTIAGLYASKEALLKSLKKGINDYPLISIEVLHDDNNAPYIKLNNKLLCDYQNKQFDVSISHDGDYAIAIVIAY